jgi:hypothetical protein
MVFEGGSWRQRRVVLADAHGHPGEVKAEADGISL